MTTQQTTVSKPSDTEIVVVREFDAPRELVWHAMTEPEHLKRWLSSERATLVEASNEPWVDGRYRNVWRLPDGSSFAFSGEYLEVERPSRVVFIERFEPIPGAESTVTSTFDDLGGRTRLTVHIRFSSQQACAGAIESGMEGGMLESYDRLDDLVRSMR